MTILSKNLRTLFTVKNLSRVSKRWSGHNNLEPHPSNFSWMKWKDMLHLYTMVAVIPLGLFTTIVNIRANPELAEIPEGYEPRHWEYYKHPISRFIARYVLEHQDEEDETMLAFLDIESERIILRHITSRVSDVMGFYNDYRALYFMPYNGADHIREGREDFRYGGEWHLGMASPLMTNLGKGNDLSDVMPTEALLESNEETKRFVR